MLRRVDLRAVQRRTEVVQLVRIGLLGKQGGAVIVLEGEGDCFDAVLEVKYEAVMLLRMGAIQARQRLDRLDPRERLVHVHGVQQRLIVAGLELGRTDQEAIRIVLYLVRDVAARKTVK